jgi:hypothetical protein
VARAGIEPHLPGGYGACRKRTFTVNVSVGDGSFNRVVVRVDGRAVARGKFRRRSVRVSCRLLSPGEHRVSASTRHWRKGKRSTTVTFTVLPPLAEPAR